MLCREGKISLFCFVVTCIVALVPEVLSSIGYHAYVEIFRNSWWYMHMIQYSILNVILLLIFRGFDYQVAVRSVFLGYAFIVSIFISCTADASLKALGVHGAILAAFHYTEFISIAWSNPKTLTSDSFILNHSVAYGVALCASWLEFFTERHFFPKMKELTLISYIGLVVCVCSEIVRKSAMFTAKSNFSHLIQSQKEEDHRLVTHGIYKLCRHPSYVGWFYWSLGTQLVLQNPLCFFAYAIVSWRFFYERILIEELFLLRFFDNEYIEYQKKVNTGLPFIHGYKMEL